MRDTSSSDSVATIATIATIATQSPQTRQRRPKKLSLVEAIETIQKAGLPISGVKSLPDGGFLVLTNTNEIDSYEDELETARMQTRNARKANGR